jgi:ribosomal protein S27E
MIGTVDRTTTLSSCDWHGQQVECELCGEVRLCTEHCELMACQRCQATLLPARGGLGIYR